MSKHFKVPINLLNSPTDPAVGYEGDIYFNDITNVIRLYKNGVWTDLIASGNLPSGGNTGQILAKSSNTDYAVEWIENYADYTETVKLKVKNDGTRSLYKGQPVYVTGADGTNVLVGRSSNNTEGGSSKTIGILAQSLATNGQGFVIMQGKLGTLDTSAANAVGDPVWLGVDGALVYGLASKPYAPAHLVYLGVVTKKNGSTGEIFVKIQNGFELTELNDVGIGYGNSISDNEVLSYDTTSSTWINKTAVEAGLVDLNSIQLVSNKKLTGSSYNSNKIDPTSYVLTLESGLYGVAIKTSTDRFDAVSHEWDFGNDGWLTTPGNILLNGDLLFQGSSIDAYETTLTVINPTADRVISLPNATGTLALSGTTLSSYGITDGIDTSITAQTKAGNLTISGIGSFNNATVTSGATSSSTTTGALKVDGGIGVTGNIYAGGNLVITGDLTVSGDTTTINTATLNVEDNIVTLNSGVTGSPTLNAGIEINRGTSTDVSLSWNETLNKWMISSEINGNKSISINESLVMEVINDQGSTLNTMDPVFISGVNIIDGSIAIQKMTSNDDKFIGFVLSSVSDGEKTLVTTRGLVSGVDTSDYLANDDLYIDSDGALTSIKPTSSLIQRVAKVLHSDLDGSIYINPEELELPYLQQSYIWIGNSLNNASQILLNTDAVTEATNLYFTNERAVSALDTTLSSYLTTSSASTTYLTQSNASSTYLTQSNALTSYQPKDQDLTDIAALTSNGFLKKTAGVWAMDTSTYLTSYTETDPIFIASEAYTITSTDTNNWDIAYGWGNHSIAGYLTTSSASATYSPKASPTFTGSITNGEAITKSTSTTISSSSATTIASIPTGLGMVLAECIILLSSIIDGSYYTSKILIRGDANAADFTEYAIIENGSMNVTFTVVPGSNVLLKAAITNTGITAKVISTYISAANGVV